MSAYEDEYLKTLHWLEVRTRAMARAGNRCQVCNCPEDLACHHRSYQHLGDLIRELADVIVLCRACHQVFHAAGRIEEPDWSDWTNRQKLYEAIEVDRARRKIQARYAEDQFTIIRATRADNCALCGRAVAVGDRVAWNGSFVRCLGECS